MIGSTDLRMLIPETEYTPNSAESVTTGHAPAAEDGSPSPYTVLFETQAPAGYFTFTVNVTEDPGGIVCEPTEPHVMSKLTG